MHDEELPGYTAPLHRALTERMLIAGVPREMALLNGTLTAVLVLGLHSWLGLPVGLLIHVVAAAAATYDAQFFAVVVRHLRYRAYYHP